MQNQIAGPGITLPAPQALYPSPLNNDPYVSATNEISLQSGQSVIVPAGDWNIDLGRVCVLQQQDPINQPNIATTVGVWRSLAIRRGLFRLRSDGVNYRVFNPTGVPVGAVVTKGGTTYTQAGTTVTPSSGNSTWLPIIGGRVTPITVANKGAGYSLPPVVNITCPAGPGVAATAIANLSGTTGTVASITIINEGAGYASAPTIVITPSPFDPNLASGSFTTATATASLTGSGTLSAVLCTNNGTTLGSTVPTLTVTGGDSSGTATALLALTVTAITVSAVGSGTLTSTLITTTGGGVTATPVFANPAVELTQFVPQPLNANISVAAGAIQAGTGVILDPGLFLSTPLPVVVQSGGLINTAATVTLTMGAITDTVIIQPA